MQCYFQFNARARFNILKNNLPSGTHIELAKSSPYQNYVYCSKDNNYVETGERPFEPTRKRKMYDEHCELLKKFAKDEITLAAMGQQDDKFIVM